MAAMEVTSKVPCEASDSDYRSHHGPGLSNGVCCIAQTACELRRLLCALQSNSSSGRLSAARTRSAFAGEPGVGEKLPSSHACANQNRHSRRQRAMLNQLTQWPTRSKSWTPYPSLRNARAREDLWTESFFGGLDAAFWDRSFAYTNHQGKDYLETAHVACRHLFNHQTHHRVQACDATAKTSATVFSGRRGVQRQSIRSNRRNVFSLRVLTAA